MPLIRYRLGDRGGFVVERAQAQALLGAQRPELSLPEQLLFISGRDGPAQLASLADAISACREALPYLSGGFHLDVGDDALVVQLASDELPAYLVDELHARIERELRARVARAERDFERVRELRREAFEVELGYDYAGLDESIDDHSMVLLWTRDQRAAGSVRLTVRADGPLEDESVLALDLWQAQGGFTDAEIGQCSRLVFIMRACAEAAAAPWGGDVARPGTTCAVAEAGSWAGSSWGSWAGWP